MRSLLQQPSAGLDGDEAMTTETTFNSDYCGLETLVEKTRIDDETLSSISEYLPSTGFRPTGFGEERRRERYAHTTNGDEGKESWEEMCLRVAEFAAEAEDEHQGLWQSAFYHVLVNGYVSPGGRVWRNSGTENPMISNCFGVGSVGDSREEWAKMAHDLIMITALGAGWGCDLSEIRPQGAEIKGLGGGQEAGGPRNLMDLANSTVEPIRSAGNRRAALWLGLSARHPDIGSFVNAKNDDGSLANMNISVSFIDESPSEFFQAVNDGDEWETRWEHDDDERSVEKTYDARVLWDEWFDSMTSHGDPAIMNFHRINERYNCSYLESEAFDNGRIRSCNACSEEPMLEKETCTLSNLVIPRFDEFVGEDENGEPTFEFNWQGFAIATRLQTRLLDNIIEEAYFIDEVPKHEHMKKSLRRIGNGFMGLAEHLAMQGHRYSNEDGRDEAERVARTMTSVAYDASAGLASERGAFPEYDEDGFFEDGNFVNRLPEAVKERVREHGARNSIVSNVPPCGTTSTVQDVTGGLEPMYAVAQKRRYRTPEDEWGEDFLVNSLFEEYVKRGWSTAHFENGCGIEPGDQLRLLERVQRWVDAGTSKTTLIPEDYDDDELQRLAAEWAPRLLSFAFYRIGSKENQPITPVSVSEARERLSEDVEATGEDKQASVLVNCEDGSCEI